VKIKNFQALYPFEGYVIESVNCEAIGMQINLRRDLRYGLKCPDCGSKMRKNRETVSTAFDLSCGKGPVVFIRYPSIQGTCSQCGRYKTVRPAEIHLKRRATWRLMRFVSQLARYVPFDAMASLIEVPAATAWRYDRDVLKADLPPPDLDGIEALLIDEKYLGRGHGYVTLVLNAGSGELLFMDQGKKKETLGAFFEMLSDEQKASIKAVCIDRNGAYAAAITEHLPKAEIVYDKFHLMSNLNKVIDEVRREEYEAASKETKNVIKGQRFNLLRHPENLAPSGELALRGLLEINEKINVAYLLKDQFRFVWDYRYAGWARRYLKQWISWVRESGIKPLIRFAKGIERDIERVVSWCRYPITNGRIEGFNSKVSQIVFKARGLRSLDYLYLKLRQESALQN
jgi:transposase